MKQINWGFIGCGDVTEHKSGQAFNMVEGSRIVAVMSRNMERVRAYAERFGIDKWYTDAQALIDDPEVNAVYICTPPASHATYAIMAMRAGKPVYVEKPLAANYDDCSRVNYVSRETGKPCFVAYYRRYLPYFQKVKELLDNGRIGKIQTVHIRYACQPRPEDYNPADQQPWRVKPEIAGGGYFYDMAPHQFDLLQQFFGVIVQAEGYCANHSGLYHAEDTVNACFKFENGLTGSGSWCFASHESSREDRVEIIGDAGSICFSMFTPEPIRLHTSSGVEEMHIENPEYVQQPLIQCVVETLQGVNDCQCTSLSATPTNWTMDKILGKF